MINAKKNILESNHRYSEKKPKNHKNKKDNSSEIPLNRPPRIPSGYKHEIIRAPIKPMYNDQPRNQGAYQYANYGGTYSHPLQELR